MRNHLDISAILGIETSTTLNNLQSVNKPLVKTMAKNIHKRKLSQKTSTQPFNDRYLALEESCKLTGLTYDEFFSVMKAFTKCSEGHMAFFLGDLTLYFEARENEIILSFDVEHGKTIKTVQHRFNSSEVKMLYKKNLKTNC
jgi:hypothetical protein